MQESLRLWGLPRFDLMQIHNMVDWEVHLTTLKEWKAQGRIRYIGITTSHGRRHDALEAAMRREDFDYEAATNMLAMLSRLRRTEVQLPDLVEQSWKRCLTDYNLLPDTVPRAAVLSHSEIQSLMQGFAIALSFKNILLMFAGVILGVIIGVLPGAGGTIAGGSTITKDTPAGALSVARGKQVSIANWTRPKK